MTGPTVRWMKERSSAGGYALCGSLIIGGEGKFFNRMIFVTPEGEVTFYDKRHLHSVSGEHTAYSRGNKRVVVSYREFSFNLQVCYDLRFPVWSRNRGDTDVIIYSANWPAVRSSVWKALLVARAIENQCYVIGVNRVGENPDGTTYTGDSAIIGPRKRDTCLGRSPRTALLKVLAQHCSPWNRLRNIGLKCPSGASPSFRADLVNDSAQSYQAVGSRQ
ncbi:MAG: nitrilase-related carbon-nitrogen hydrolase [Bacteroidales bacterium]|nr:nitrilase-related carbon-nitrogen hydrolase [Bacteroidales bacterium]